MPLRDGLAVWPAFVELCERRNLLTHTGGAVLQQYLRNCADNKCKVDAKLGDTLIVDHKYFKDAIKTVAEVGLKLGHVMWRKFLPSDRSQADGDLNKLGMKFNC